MAFGNFFSFLAPVLESIFAPISKIGGFLAQNPEVALQALSLVGQGFQTAQAFAPQPEAAPGLPMLDALSLLPEPPMTVQAPTPTTVQAPTPTLKPTREQLIARRAGLQERGLSGASPEFMASMLGLSPEDYQAFLGGSLYG